MSHGPCMRPVQGKHSINHSSDPVDCLLLTLFPLPTQRFGSSVAIVRRMDVDHAYELERHVKPRTG